ncbi:MAG: hypothetical protein R6X02_18855 [Enhygromyxa sp.]
MANDQVMHELVALTTAFALTTMVGWGQTALTTAVIADLDVPIAELLMEQHYSEQGFEVDLYVTRAADGTVLSEATVFDPTSADQVEVWTDGVTLWWEGTIDGRPVSGSEATIDVLDPDDPQAFCLHPIGAIVCLGVLVGVFSGCGAGFGCPPQEPSNPPDSSGHGGGGGGGGGDAEGDGGGEGEGDGGDE